MSNIINSRERDAGQLDICFLTLRRSGEETNTVADEEEHLLAASVGVGECTIRDVLHTLESLEDALHERGAAYVENRCYVCRMPPR